MSETDHCSRDDSPQMGNAVIDIYMDFLVLFGISFESFNIHLK